MPYAEPNTRIKAVKVSFGSGVVDDIRLKEAIRSAVERHSVLAQRATWLLKLYCLECREEESLCRLDKDDLVLHCLGVVSGQARVRKAAYREQMDFLRHLYRRHIEPLLLPDERVVVRNDLQNPLRYTATRILTAYKNQIQCHFLRLLNKLRQKDPVEGEADAESILQLVDISENGIAFDVVAEPLKFLPSLFRLHEQYRRREWKLFQCCPLSRSNIPMHLTADTTTLRGWVGQAQCRRLADNEVWDAYLRLPIGKLSAWRFTGTFQTDGVAITFLYKKFVAGFKRKRGNKKKAAKDDPFDADGIRRFDTLTADERAALRIEPDVRRVYCDPGKRDLLTMLDDDGRFCRYTNRRRVRDTKRLVYRDKSARRRQEMGVTGSAEERALSETTHNSNDRDEFLAYVAAKIAYLQRFGAGYRHKCHRSYRWHQYVYRQRSDTALDRHVRPYLGDPEHTVLFYGDWTSSKQLKGFISTPNLHIRRQLAKIFKRIYLLDEFRTSKLYWRDTSIELRSHVTSADRRIHALLTPKGDNEGTLDGDRRAAGSYVLVNRDKNAAHNMAAIVRHQLETGERPAAFRRRRG